MWREKGKEKEREGERGGGERETKTLKERERTGYGGYGEQASPGAPSTLAWVSDLRQATKPLQTHYLPYMVGS